MSESRQIFGRVKDATSSLLFSRDAESTGTRRSIGSQNLATINTIFSFDHEIFTSRVYRMAMRSNMTQTLLLQGHQHTDTVGHGNTVSLGSTTRPMSLSDSMADRASRAPPRLHEGGFLPSGSGIRVNREMEQRFSSVIGSQTAQGRHAIDNAVTSASLDQGNGTSTQQPLFPAEPGPTGIMGPEPEKPPPHLQFLFEPSRKSTDPDLGSLNTTGRQTYFFKKAHLRVGSTLPAIPQGRQTDDIVSKYKISVLGPAGSGKSTLIKSLDILHAKYDDHWRLLHTDHIYQDYLKVLELLLVAMDDMEDEQIDQDSAMKIWQLRTQLDNLQRKSHDESTVLDVKNFCRSTYVRKKLFQLRLKPFGDIGSCDSFRLDHSNQ